MRHATNYTVELDPSLNEARATTSFACYRTMLDGINSHIDSGETQLFLIGKYYDRFRLGEDGPKFSERNVFLDTRRLDKGSHYPI
jgi:methanesulfonate monooxygenase small subunit